MKYKSILVAQHGGPEVMQIVENDLRWPAAREVRIKVLAASVSRPDVSVRTGEALYTGTPLAQKLPFTPGYAVIGDVDAVGVDARRAAVGERVGVLTVTGGYTEMLYWRSDRLIPVPVGVDPAEAVTLILNYIVAYQTLHRSAKVKTGEMALIIGASGGIGTALLQLGRLADLKMYAIASKSKHSILTEYGATPIDYHTQDFVDEIQRAEPEGLDVVLDGMMRLDYIRRSLPLMRRGGRMVSFGEPASLPELFHILAIVAGVNLRPNGKSFKLYGTSTYFLGNRKPYLEDWTALFNLLEVGKIKPIIAAKFPILEAAKANELLESGQVTGNIVLLMPELL
ncbi:MAG: NADPH:quinone reductase [Chloroflexi bacterium]|nr:NADPH:quinone reductase [Chloroflexota bacterium]